MTSDTERYVNLTCESLVVTGHILLYRDLYKDLRERMPCGQACRLIAAGLDATRQSPHRVWTERHWCVAGWRARAIAALHRLGRYAAPREIGEPGERYRGPDRGA